MASSDPAVTDSPATPPPPSPQQEATPQPQQNHKTLLIGLSGPSSSGKTTIARLLRQIFTNPPEARYNNRSTSLIILHEDDFYKTDAEVPYTTTSPTCPSNLGSRTLQDWDCLASLDLPLFQHTLSHVKQHGTLPPDSHSKEDQNSVGPCPIPSDYISALHTSLQGWLSNQSPAIDGPFPPNTHLTIFVLDGFLLYPSPTSADPDAQALRQITALLDRKLLVLCSRAKTIARRTRRTGYVTLEGFWADPEGYVEDVVWPNYVAQHAWLMQDTEKGEEDDMLDVDVQAAREEGIRVEPWKGDADLGELLSWAMQEIQMAVEGVYPEI